DYKVTGVQTCALPISHPLVSTLGAFNVTSFPFADFLDPIVSAGTSLSISSRRPGLQGHLPQLHSGEGWPCVDIVLIGRENMPDEIGRASCRERVSSRA